MPRTLPACDSLSVPAGPLRTVVIDRFLDRLRRGLVGDAPLGEDLGQSPVHDLDLAEGAHHHVRRLQVAMDHPPRVGIGHRLAGLLEDPQEPRQVLRRARPFAEQGGQGPPLDQLHGEIRATVGESPQLVDRHDPRMLQLAADLRLLDEPPHHLGIALVRLQQHLDRQLPAQVDVATLEDRPHAAPGDLALELVPAQAGAILIGHLGRPRHDQRLAVVEQLAQLDVRGWAGAEIDGRHPARARNAVALRTALRSAPPAEGPDRLRMNRRASTSGRAAESSASRPARCMTWR